MSDEVPTGTTDVVDPRTDDGRTRIRHRRWMSWLTSFLLFAVIGSAVADGADVIAVWGVDEATVTESGPDDTRLSVTHPTVTRPALASPFEIVVDRAGGFDREIELAVDLDYIRLWDLNGIFPSPAEERSDGDIVIWTFDPPEGDVLRVLYEARIEPGAQLDGREGSVSLLEGGTAVITVEFDTKVRP